MASKREREYARRRYEKYQARSTQRAQTAARRRRQAGLGVALGVVAAAVAVTALILTTRDETPSVQADVAAAPTVDPGAAASGAADPSAAPSVAEQPPAAGTCPQPGPPPRTDPLSFPAVPDPDPTAYTVTLATTCGDIVLDLDGQAAPQAVANMTFLAREGYFDGTPCHRLTTEGIYVLQCGDPTGTGTGGPGYSWGPIENAPSDDVYPAGTVAMARQGGNGDSMGSQFFLVYEDSTIPADAAGGYTVMGTMTSGLEIVQQVAAGGLGADGTAPAESIGITGVTVEERS